MISFQKSFLDSQVHVSSENNKELCKIPPLAKNHDGRHFDLGDDQEHSFKEK
jgi:hypothetical protein